MYDQDLLSKTELVIHRIILENANLTHIAARTAEVLGFGPGEVLVVDYRDGALTLDILKTSIDARSIVGRESRLLGALREIPGVTVSPDTSIQSDGMLGWIALDRAEARQALSVSERMAEEISERIARRVIVFSTGAEVARGEIEDTNTPDIHRSLASEGYAVTRGGTLKDDREAIAARLRSAADQDAYGLIVTTGGVGAEDKDHTVEAVKTLDPGAATPYICHFTIGTGRHVKDGIRIAVGEYHGTRMVALPGPNDEVKASLDVLIRGLRAAMDKHGLAQSIAANLRAILRGKMHAPEGRHRHPAGP